MVYLITLAGIELKCSNAYASAICFYILLCRMIRGYKFPNSLQSETDTERETKCRGIAVACIDFTQNTRTVHRWKSPTRNAVFFAGLLPFVPILAIVFVQKITDYYVKKISIRNEKRCRNVLFVLIVFCPQLTLWAISNRNFHTFLAIKSFK